MSATTSEESIHKENVPEEEEQQMSGFILEADDEDPLVSQIKEQKHRQSRLGLDPTTSQTVEAPHRGIDP